MFTSPVVGYGYFQESFMICNVLPKPSHKIFVKLHRSHHLISRIIHILKASAVDHTLDRFSIDISIGTRSIGILIDSQSITPLTLDQQLVYRW